VVVEADHRGRIVVADSVTLLDDSVRSTDVLAVGSFAGTLALGLALERGVRGIIAHAAGVGRDEAGIRGLALADRCGIPAAAVDTMSARLGDGRSVLDDGVVAHVNRMASALGVRGGMTARAAGRRMLDAPAGRPPPAVLPVDRAARVLLTTAAGRVVALGSASFAEAAHAGDVLCAGSHGGRVNVEGLLRRVRPRGAIFNDGGLARERSGVSGLALLAEAGVAGAAVSAASARIGDGVSTYEDGVISALNACAAGRAIAVGQPARQAALRMLDGREG
jgi:hypothetical protein